MERPAPLRAELASVCRFLALKRARRLATPESPRSAPTGILADLAALRGLQ